MPWFHRKLVFSIILGTRLLSSTRAGVVLALMIFWLPLMAASSRAFMCGAEAMKALKAVGWRGLRRIRSCRADSCREHEASGAVANVFSSRRKETRRGNSTTTSWAPISWHNTNISIWFGQTVQFLIWTCLSFYTLCRAQLQNMFNIWISRFIKESFQAVCPHFDGED